MPVYFHKEDVKLRLQQPAHIKKWIQSVIIAAEKKTGTLNFIFCSDEYLLRMNQQYLNHDYYTDVITFPQSDDDDVTISGDIFISIDRVRDNAGKHPFENELHRVMVHGVLHLLGHSDKTPAKKKKMRKMEDACLKGLVRIK